MDASALVPQVTSLKIGLGFLMIEFLAAWKAKGFVEFEKYPPEV